MLTGFRENSPDARGLTYGSIDLRLFTSVLKIFTFRSTQGGRQVERIEWVRVTRVEYRRQSLKEMSFQQDSEAYGKNENALSLKN